MGQEFRGAAVGSALRGGAGGGTGGGVRIWGLESLEREEGEGTGSALSSGRGCEGGESCLQVWLSPSQFRVAAGRELLSVLCVLYVPPTATHSQTVIPHEDTNPAAVHGRARSLSAVWPFLKSFRARGLSRDCWQTLQKRGSAFSEL